jgi:hypothetical protein|nr:MAG TPA: hypothetical protein [Caudoviricetes sp.]
MSTHQNNKKTTALTEAMLPKLRKTVHIEGEKKQKSFAKHRRKSYVYDAEKDKYVKVWRNPPKKDMTKKELKEFYGHGFKVTFTPVREIELKKFNITLRFNRSNQFIDFTGVEDKEDIQMVSSVLGQPVGKVLQFFQDI